MNILNKFFKSAAADSTAKVTISDNIGSKDDTFTLGVDTPDATYSIIRWLKGIYASFAYQFSVQSADSASNVYIQDPIGNKDDTISGNSIVALEKQILASIDKVYTKAITLAANTNAASAIATAFGQAVKVESVILKAVTAQTADLTSAAITAGTAGVIEIFSAAEAAQANLNAISKRLVNTGEDFVLDVGESIYITPMGTGATALDLMAYITYKAVVAGGNLSLGA